MKLHQQKKKKLIKKKIETKNYVILHLKNITQFISKMAEFKACDRQYVKTTWEPSAFITALEYMKVTNINALENKLLTGDKQDFKKKEIVRSSPFRKQVLPGILVLSGNTYGRYKNKLYYKCIPNDKSLPVFLVPYQEKNINFNKSKIDKFVLFVFQKWTDKHLSLIHI